MESVFNVLADRYASSDMLGIWSAEGKIRVERSLWIAVMRAQQSLGLSIPDEAIDAYERVVDTVDVASIKERERITRHDVKARIEEFCDLAGHEYVHMGMTSRDLTENVEQLQVKRSLDLVLKKAIAVLAKIQARAEENIATPLAARTHNVAAQVTSVGKRWAMFGEELLLSVKRLESLIEMYPLRGLKGAVGTQKDALQLLGGDVSKVQTLEKAVSDHLGFAGSLSNVGQVYPRSLDTAVVDALVELASGPSNFAKTLRLMAGQDLASEGFAPGQTGSSAMPHKMNSRSCERVNGFHTILKGYQTMASGLAGDQWNEGDVSCSVVRRVCLPDAFFAIDGLFETFLTVLNQMDVNDAVVDAEVVRYLPFLASTSLLMATVGKGMGREQAHGLVKKHALAAIAAMRSGETVENRMLADLSTESDWPLSLDEMEALLEKSKYEMGMAESQVSAFSSSVEALIHKYPAAKGVEPESIL
ncbi:MAG: adenylosuccinate lyase [Opitutales bacterium]